MITRATGHTRVRNKSSYNLDVFLHQTRSHNTQTQLGVMRAGIFANKQREHTNQPRDCLRVLSPRRSPRRARLTPHPLSFSSALLLSFSLALLLSAGHALVCTRHALTSDTNTTRGDACWFIRKQTTRTHQPTSGLSSWSSSPALSSPCSSDSASSFFSPRPFVVCGTYA